MRKPSLLAAAAVVVSLVAGCAVDGAAVRGPIDLDLGKYAGRQATALPEATTASAWARLRAVRLADHIVFPAEIDPTLLDLKMPTMPVVVPKNLGVAITDADTLPVMNDLQYGFSIAAGSESDHLGINHMVLRFTDDRTAGTAVRQVGDLLAKPKDWYKSGGGRVQVAGMPPGSVVVHRESSTSDKHIYMTAVQSGPYLIYTWADAEERALGERTVVGAYRKQKAMLDAIGPENESRNPDPTGLIRGTVKVTSDERSPLTETVWGRRGAALLYNNGPEALAALDKAGVTAGAINKTQAYRAASPAQAEGWRDYLVKAFGDDTSRKAESPRDLGSATCLTKSDRAGCFIVVGPYVGEVYAPDLLDAQQQISAAYTFLKTLS